MRRAGKALMVAVRNEGIAGGRSVKLINVDKKRSRGMAVWWCGGVACLLCSSVNPECGFFLEDHICAFSFGPCSLARRCWLRWDRAVCCLSPGTHSCTLSLILLLSSMLLTEV